jgi:lysophospholipase
MSNFFFEIPGNPVPEGAFADFYVGTGATRIRYALFPPAATPAKGTVILLAGRNECIEKYFETIRDLAARGFGVATFDWRGQGASDRLIRNPAKGHVRSFQDYVLDLERFFEEIVLPDCRGPYFILGHSTGSLVALLAAPAMLNRVQRMFLCAPLLAFADIPFSMATARRLSSLLWWLGLGRMYMGSGRRGETTPFSRNVLTSDEARYRRNAALYDAFPQLALGAPTVGWVRAACRAIARIHDPEFINRIRIPILFVAAGADTVVSTPAIEAYAGRLKSGGLLTIDHARHEIFQEADIYREQLLAAFDAFIPGTDPAG